VAAGTERQPGAPTKREQVIALVRGMIADGTLKPGDLAPTTAALARKTGFAAVTCQTALAALVADGTLMRGVSVGARLRVTKPGAGRIPQAPEVALSRMLAARRRAAGLTQPKLAELLGVSVTTVGHAETGRTWQARGFWQCADDVLGCGGDLLRLHDAYRGAGHGTAAEASAPAADSPPLPVLPLSIARLAAAGVLVTWAGGTETVAAAPGQGAQSW
jgi:hypothetical protein